MATMTPAQERRRRFLQSHRVVYLYLTPRDFNRLRRQQQRLHCDSYSQWAHTALAVLEAQREREAETLIRKNVPRDLAQAAESLFLAESERLLRLADRYRQPAQWAERHHLREQAGWYLDWAGWCRDVIDAYDRLPTSAAGPTRPETPDSTVAPQSTPSALPSPWDAPPPTP